MLCALLSYGIHYIEFNKFNAMWSLVLSSLKFRRTEYTSYVIAFSKMKVSFARERKPKRKWMLLNSYDTIATYRRINSSHGNVHYVLDACEYFKENIHQGICMLWIYLKFHRISIHKYFSFNPLCFHVSFGNETFDSSNTVTYQNVTYQNVIIFRNQQSIRFCFTKWTSFKSWKSHFLKERTVNG